MRNAIRIPIKQHFTIYAPEDIGEVTVPDMYVPEWLATCAALVPIVEGEGRNRRVVRFELMLNNQVPKT